MKKTILIVLMLISALQISAQLKNDNNQADYIIITVPVFTESLEQLKDYRSSDGLAVSLIDTDQITNEFSGESVSAAIRMFVSYALTNWKDPKPRYLLLAGDVEFIPSVKVESAINSQNYQEDSVSIDALYSVNIYQNDVIPDIAVGRIPANNVEEIQVVTDKIIRFENNADHISPNSIILVDKQDGQVFQSFADQFQQLFEEKNIPVEMVSAYQDTNSGKVRGKFIQQINDMPLFVSYAGHGNPYVWSADTLFGYENVSELTNYEVPFIYAGVSCKFNFDQENDSTISEGLLFSQSGGAVAGIGSSGLNYASTGIKFIKSFWTNAFISTGVRIGDAVLACQVEDFDEFSQRFTLLGDPALKIPVIIIADVGTETIPEQFTLRQNYPNPFNPTTVIEYQIPEDSNVSLQIFDILGNRIKNIEKEFKQAGNYAVEIDMSNFVSGIYLYQLQTRFGTVVRKMSLLK